MMAHMGMSGPAAGVFGVSAATGMAAMGGLPGMPPMAGMPPMGALGGMMGAMGGMPPAGRTGKGFPSMPTQFQQQPPVVQAPVPSFGFGGPAAGGSPGRGGRGGGGGGKNARGGGGQGHGHGHGGHGGKAGGGSGKGGHMGGGAGAAPTNTIPAQMSVNGVATWVYGQSTSGHGGGSKGGGKDGGKGVSSGKSAGGSAHRSGAGDGGFPGRPHSNVFVGNLAADTDEAALSQVFASYGDLKSCTVMTNNGRTYGFVKFASVNAASKAVSELQSNDMNWLVKHAHNDMDNSGGKGFGKWMGQEYGKGSTNSKVDHTNIFVGGLPSHSTEDHLRTAFSPCGQIKSCVVVTKADQTFGLVEFCKVDEAKRAIEEVNGRSGWDVKFANNDARAGGWNSHLSHSNVYVGNLSDDIDQATLQEAFAEYGTVSSCMIHTAGGGKEDDKPDEEGRRYGFVKFATVSAAARAIGTLNDTHGWTVKLANNDLPTDGKGWGKGYMWIPDDYFWNSAGNGGWVWQSGERSNNKIEDRPEPEPTDNLYVKNLPSEISEEDVHAMFSKVGAVVECRVLRWDDASGCAALVRMASVELATQARNELSGKVHESTMRPLHVANQEKNHEKVPDHLYVKGLHCNSTKEQIETLFSDYGTVQWCKILPLPWEPRSGDPPDVAALVQMGSEEEATSAVQGLDGKVAPQLGQSMVVRFAESKVDQEKTDVKPNNNVYVKGWPVGFPDFLLQSIFQQYGSVIRLRLLENPDPEQPTCAALVQMSRVEEATLALRNLHGQTLDMNLPSMRIRYAGKDRGPSDNLYLTALPRTVTESNLRQTFEKYGEIKRLRLLQQPNSHETHALVQLSSPQVAAQALRDLDNNTPKFKGPTLFVAYAAKRDLASKR